MTHRFAFLASALILSAAARADGLADLRAALQRSTASQSLQAAVSVKTEHRQGEGQDAITDLGSATLMLEDGVDGLQLHYAADTLARVQQEGAARDADAMARTPTVWGLNALDYRTLRGMSSAADKLKSLLADSTFKGESIASWNGRSARLLTFDFGPGKLREQQKKYIKNSEGSLQIWIAADGTPLESRSQLKMSGRAMLVISFETLSTARVLYERIGERLIATRRETLESGAGAGEKGEDRSEITLQPKS